MYRCLQGSGSTVISLRRLGESEQRNLPFTIAVPATPMANLDFEALDARQDIHRHSHGYLFIYTYGYLFKYTYGYLFIYTYGYLFIYTYGYLFIHSYGYLFTYSYGYLFIDSYDYRIDVDAPGSVTGTTRGVAVSRRMA